MNSYPDRSSWELAHFLYRHVDEHVMIIQLEMCHLEILQPPSDGTRGPKIHHSDQYTGLGSDRTIDKVSEISHHTDGDEFFSVGFHRRVS